MVVTKPVQKPKIVRKPKAVPMPVPVPKVIAQPKPIDKNQKRVVTRENRAEILRQSTHVYQEQPEVYYEVAPNPSAATQYYYNPQTDQYEYIDAGY
jgi:outer membrane biosynthesis protein TonB